MKTTLKFMLVLMIFLTSTLLSYGQTQLTYESLSRANLTYNSIQDKWLTGDATEGHFFISLSVTNVAIYDKNSTLILQVDLVDPKYEETADATLYTFRQKGGSAIIQYLLRNKPAQDENLGILWISDRSLGKGIILSLDYLITHKTNASTTKAE